MQILTDYRVFPPALRGGVLCIGNFDGVHIGHARMLTTGRDLARDRQVKIPFTIMTFDPHPSAILHPDKPRLALSTPALRQELLAAFNPDILLVIPTSKEFLATPPEIFLADIVHTAIGATHIVEGQSFTYGRGAKGTIETLQSQGPHYGFATSLVPSVEITMAEMIRVAVSSSTIRWLIENGRVLDAALALGRPYTLRGPIVEGQKRGRSIGYPTANLQTPQLLPAAGIYAGRAVVAGRSHVAAISVGTNPTFAGAQTTVEAHFLDFDADIYGQTIDLEFHRYIREMHTFGGVAPLVRQMARDVALTRQLIRA